MDSKTFWFGGAGSSKGRTNPKRYRDTAYLMRVQQAQAAEGL
jgi:hypothetical protein